MILKTRDLEHIFRKFRIEPKKSKHHVSGFVVYNGRRILPVHYSFGRKDMPGHVSDKFRKSLAISKDEIQGAVDCWFDYEQYVKRLKEQNIIESQ